MSPVLKVQGVRAGGAGDILDFELSQGDLRVWQCEAAALPQLADWFTGAAVPESGGLQIAQPGAAAPSWEPLHQARPGRVAWVAGNGGLISNLKIWENVTLPRWYHFRRDARETEAAVRTWLPQLGLAEDEFAAFMAAPPARLPLWQCQVAGMLRALVQQPQLMVLEAELFFDQAPERLENWRNALEQYAAQGGCVLVLGWHPVPLGWPAIMAGGGK